MGTFTGFGLIKACAEATDNLDVLEKCGQGRKFTYQAPRHLFDTVEFELGGPSAQDTGPLGAPTSAGPAAAAGARAAAGSRTAAGARAAAAAAAAVPLPSTPPVSARQAMEAAASPAGGGGVRGVPGRVRVPSSSHGDLLGGGSGDPELMYLLQIKVSAFVDCCKYCLFLETCSRHVALEGR